MPLPVPLNNLYFRCNAAARERRARQLWERRYRTRPDNNEAAAEINADPLRTRRIVAEYQATLKQRIDRVQELAEETVMRSLGNALLRAAAASDGEPGLFNSLDIERAGIEFEAWTRRTMMQVVLDSDVAGTTPRAGHYLVTLNAQTIGVAAVQAYDKARQLGIGVSEELETFVVNVRSATPADILATRQYGLLRNMNFDTGAELREELITGMRAGKTAEDIAQTISSRLQSINLTRARVIARTEITNAHAEATLNAFEISGIRTVEALVEFTTNVHGSAAPCPQCSALAGRVYTIEAARGVIPVHGNCQCGWVPVSARYGLN